MHIRKRKWLKSQAKKRAQEAGPSTPPPTPVVETPASKPVKPAKPVVRPKTTRVRKTTKKAE